MNGISSVEVGNLKHLSHYGPSGSKDSSTPSSHSTPRTTNTSTERPARERPRKGSITLDTALKPAPGKPTTSTPHVAETQATHTISRRPSWLASFSQKFSSSGSEVATTAPATATPTSADSAPTASQSQAQTSQASQPSQSQAAQAPASNAPQKPTATTSIASAGFLMNTLRRLSSSGATAREAFSRKSSQQPQPQCERVILNKDSRRDRSGIPELDGNRLRKVSFCVDVEVAPCHEDVQERKEARKRRREEREKMKRLKEDGTPETAGSGTETPGGVANTDGAGAVQEGAEKKAEGEKKKEDGESEKKEGAEDSQNRPKSSPAPSAATDPTGSTASPAPTSSTTSTDKPKPRKRIHPKATTDPLKIYTQCCQLRETSIVTVIKDSLIQQRLPATLQILDLTSLRLPLHDLVTLADFLALVPIRKLVLENCDIDDHVLRMLLSGLGAVKKITQEEPELDPDDTGPRKQRGAVERLSIKGNKRITKEGWKMLSTFVHMNRSLRALDCSGILMPKGLKAVPNTPLTPHTPMTPTTPASVVSAKSFGTPITPQSPVVNKIIDDPATLLSKALSDRLCGHGLEELVLAGCGLDTQQISTILEGATKGGTRRLGLGYNPINDDGLAIIGAWLKTGACEALDLTGVDVSEHINILSCCLIETSPLAALSLSGCSLTPASLTSLLPSLSTLSNLRHLDLSSNPALFSSTPSAFHALRQNLPELKMLRKLDLSKTGMTSDQAIALCELLPQIPQLSYFRITGNNLLSEGDGSQSVAETRAEATAEEGAALYTALVAAAKVSRTIVRIDLDDPPEDSADVIHRLSRKLLAYCLRNMEANASNDDWSLDGDVVDSVNNLATAVVEKAAGNRKSEEMESLQELTGSTVVGNIKNESTTSGSTLNGASITPSISPSLSRDDDDDEEEDEEDDHVVGTGVVKALGVCLGNSTTTGKEANEMSKALLTRARNIKARIQPALARAAVGETEEMKHRRLLFLDDTLFRVIMRFEEEYPSCKLPGKPMENSEMVPEMLIVAEEQRLAESQELEFLPRAGEYQETLDPPTPPTPPHPDPTEHQQDRRDSTDSQQPIEEETEQPRSISRVGSRRNSSTDLHSKSLQEEEGRMHVLGTRLLEASRNGMIRRTESLDGEELKRRIIEGEISAPGGKEDGEGMGKGEGGRGGLAPGEMPLEGEIGMGVGMMVNGVGRREAERNEVERNKVERSDLGQSNLGQGEAEQGEAGQKKPSNPLNFHQESQSGRRSDDISPVSSVTFHTPPSYQPSPPPRPGKSASRKFSSGEGEGGGGGSVGDE